MFLSADRKQVHGHIAQANAQWKYWTRGGDMNAEIADLMEAQLAAAES